MRSIYAKLSLFLLFSSAALVAIKRPSIGQAFQRSEAEVKKLAEEFAPMNMATFIRSLNVANLAEEDIWAFLESIVHTEKPFSWRNPGKKMIFLLEKISLKGADRRNLGLLLMWAYEKNDRKTIKKLRALGVKDSEALFGAIYRKPDNIPLLLKEGARPDRKTVESAIRWSEHDVKLRAMLPQLIKKMKNINQRDKDGATVIFGAFDDKEIAEILLNAGAKINAQDNDGFMVLMLAVKALEGAVRAKDEKLKKKCFEAITYLVQQGANPNIKNKQGESARSMAKKAGLTDLVRLFEGSNGLRKR